MRMIQTPRMTFTGLALTAAFLLGSASAGGQAREAAQEIKVMLPQVAGWRLAEAAQSFFPETLFERIDGAAESYLAYDFKELLAADFERREGEASLSAEIYDMGTPLNAFGIYSAERFPENRPVAVGLMGYIEGEALNFIAGRYYVKLLSFGAGPQTADVLTDFARKISAPVQDPGALPAIFTRFPRENMIAMSEKFINRNFLGFEFLGRGFQVSYRFGQQEFEGFVAAFDGETQAKAALQRLLEFYAKDRAAAKQDPLGWRIKTRYGQSLMVGARGTYLAGVVRVPDGLEAEAGGRFRAILEAMGGAED